MSVSDTPEKQMPLKIDAAKLSEQEKQVILHMRDVPDGTVSVIMKNGIPIRVELTSEAIDIK